MARPPFEFAEATEHHAPHFPKAEKPWIISESRARCPWSGWLAREYAPLAMLAPAARGGGGRPTKGLFQPPRRIMSKKSRLVLLAFILSSMNSIASISSIG